MDYDAVSGGCARIWYVLFMNDFTYVIHVVLWEHDAPHGYDNRGIYDRTAHNLFIELTRTTTYIRVGCTQTTWSITRARGQVWQSINGWVAHAGHRMRTAFAAS